jgi:hypothetical protein
VQQGKSCAAFLIHTEKKEFLEFFLSVVFFSFFMYCHDISFFFFYLCFLGKRELRKEHSDIVALFVFLY